MQPLNREELFSAMVNRSIVSIGNTKGFINAIEMEDGSGYSFNVRICQKDGQQYKTVYIRFVNS